MDKIPYREGEPPPPGNYVLAELIDDDGRSTGRYWIKPEDLHKGPIQHEEVEGLGPPLRWVWRHLQKHLTWCRSFEDWELEFLRDAHPAKEVAIWIRAPYA